jgi:hypothetical protein
MPYAQRITQLIYEYEIDNLTVAEPCYETVIEISPVNIDLTLTSKISKSNLHTESLVTANLHISKNCTDHFHIYTNGIKDPDAG